MATIPTAWVTIPTMSLASGTPVAGGSGSVIEDLAHNNEMVHARYAGMLFAGARRTISGTGLPTTWVEQYRIAVPACADEVGLVIEIDCDDGGTDAQFKAESHGDSGITDTIAVSAASGRARRTLTLTASTGSKDTVGVYVYGADAVIYGITARWKSNYTNTVSAVDPEASGFLHVSTSLNAGDPYETDSDRAVTDELLQRMLTNPRAVWADRPCAQHAMGDVLDIGAGALWQTDSGSRAPFSAHWTHVRYACTLRWLVHVSTAASTWEVRITDSTDPDGYVVVDDGDTPVSWGGVNWYEVTMSCAAGEREFLVDLTSDGSNDLQLVSLQAIVEAP